MAAASGEKGPLVTTALAREPWPVGFFQAARLIALGSGGDPPGGAFSDAGVRFAASTGLAFPASEIQSIEFPAGAPATMRVNIMGLTGPLGVLPLFYTTLLCERDRAGDHAARDFFDLFHHRLLSLFYRAWEKHRCGIAWERGARDPLCRLADMIGLGTPGLADRQDVPDTVLLFHAGLLAMRTRPAAALEQLLRDYFALPVEIEQFVGRWRPVDPADQCVLGPARGPSNRLGMGALAGYEVWDQQSRIRLRLGPLSLHQYREFLPGGPANRRLRSLCMFYAGLEFDIETQLILRREDVPECSLGAAIQQLGWTTWAESTAFSHDPGDAVLEFIQAA